MEPEEGKEPSEEVSVVEVAQDLRSGNDAEQWIKRKLGLLPKTSLGWFRAGVGFYNKKQYALSIQCFQRSVDLDPKNYNAYQIMARACIAVNRRDDAIMALKESVKLDNPSDWQLLVELTGGQTKAR
ncbi:Tetratricopeptide repeat protein 27 [Hondaea fermentalgiana]|uniref:Tetratricopeptide repeat protein 27 n=1 Tax=Hondaea fermentalgiana TaxID=2315210 RepID=A0A2R5GS77_9STRA|nr:Tetratricopeptide repeat protein 27 [Hondaea fermentalgiana]|eukprot:GBG33737.1 Tetratricopeptide repeat protein 27 [Hondaea fermentalgiana]